MTSKKILIVGERGSGKLSLVQSLCGSLPSCIQADTHGGLIHELSVVTKYYSATIGVWIDELEHDKITEFCDLYSSSADAELVTSSIGVLIVPFCTSHGSAYITDLLEQLARIVSDDVQLLAVGEGNTVEEDWEEVCLNAGFEYINARGEGLNEFGEKQGIARVREVIESCHWDAQDTEVFESLDDLTAENAQLHEALLTWDDGDEDHVEDMDQLMQRVLVAREHLQGLSLEDKKREAARLVADIMKSV